MTDPTRGPAGWPEGTAGRLMSPDFLAFPPGLTVRQVVERLRARARTGDPVNYAYLVDADERLAGVLNMRDLLLADPDAAAESTARRRVVSVPATAGRERLAELAEEMRFLSFPVVDADGRLLGTMRTEALVGSLREEASGDLLKLFGAGEDERAFSPPALSARKRLPWLLVNLGTAFLASWVVGLFESALARLSVLAVCLPIVAGQGGNAGAQSLAVVMRGLALKEIPREAAARLVLKEGALGLANGAVVGAVAALGALAWQGSPALGLVLGLAMVVNMATAGLSGAAIPLVMKRLGFDPAQSSSIVQTTVTDVVGFASFLGFATLAMPWLD